MLNFKGPNLLETKNEAFVDEVVRHVGLASKPSEVGNRTGEVRRSHTDSLEMRVAAVHCPACSLSFYR